MIWADGAGDAPCTHDSTKYWKAPNFISWLYNNGPNQNTVLVNNRPVNVTLWSIIITEVNLGGVLDLEETTTLVVTGKRKIPHSFLATSLQ